jgi:predicted secreted Zn-dependent protease
MLHVPQRLGDLSWRVARSCAGGSCVGVAARGDEILIRSTKRPGGPVVAYSREEWAAFVEGIRQGDFDDL